MTVKVQAKQTEASIHTIEALADREYTSRSDLARAKREAATKLGVTVRQINRFLSQSGAYLRPEPIKKREETASNAADTREKCINYAIEVLQGHRTLAEAAIVANRHERSIRRVLDNLPIPVRFPDYGRLGGSTRYALSENVRRGRCSKHLTPFIEDQINPGKRIGTNKTTRLTVLGLMSALNGEKEANDPVFKAYFRRYKLKGVDLLYLERLAIAHLVWGRP